MTYHSDLRGTLLDGRYRIGDELGRGGMSVVYEGEDLRLLRTVAIKLLRGPSSGVLAERLFREAKAAARADHPAIVTVFGYGTDAATGLDYLVMERLRGDDLAKRVMTVGPLPIDLVLRIGIEAADALAAVHEAGVVHRDLKPANIFLSRRGLRVDEIKLLDFGTAKHLDLHTLTAPGQVLGTLAYMAPEQLSDPKRVDGRADLYALGVSLYECLAGVLPFSTRSAADLLAALHLGALRATPLATHRDDVPPGLSEAIARCLARRPEERFPSAHLLREALRRAR